MYFIPLQLGILAGLLWANIDESNYNYLWGTDSEGTMELGFSIGGHHVVKAACSCLLTFSSC